MKRVTVRISASSVLLLLLAACGGASSPPVAASSTVAKPSSGASSSPAQPPPSTSAKPAASASASAAGPYRFAAVFDLTGPYTSLGVPAKTAIDLEVKKLNAAGGINGHPVEMLYEDGQSDPSKGVVALKKLLDSKPIVHIGPTFSSTSLALIPIEDQAKLPTMAIAADESQVHPTHKFVFMEPPPSELQAQVLLSYLKKANLTKIATIHDSSAFGKSGPDDIKASGAKFGVQVVDDEVYNLTDTDMTVQLTKIKNNAEVQAVVQWGAGGPPVIVAKNFAALGFKVPFILSHAVNDPAFVKAAGAAANGALNISTKLPLLDYIADGDPGKKTLADFTASYTQATGHGPESFAGDGYDAFHIMANAVKQAGTDPDKIVDAVEHTKFEGVQGTYNYTAEAHAGMTTNALAMTVIKDGKFVPITPNCDGCMQTKVAK